MPLRVHFLMKPVGARLGGAAWMRACFIVLLLSIPAFADPRVEVVIGEKAPALERLAADELANQLRRVYEADVKISSTAPADAPHVIFVGSPETNTNMKPFAASWPSGDKKLTDQGHLLRSVTHNNKPALLIGGGSPVATYWAVAEFGHRLGIRSLLFGDLDPISPPEFKLDGIDVVLEPQQREREWHFRNGGPMDSGSWGVDEHRRVIQQLAKLKFNRININVRASQPFVHFEFQGVERWTEGLWGFNNLDNYAVSGDTSGRKVFGWTKLLFENPSFASATTYEERIAAGKQHLTGIVDAAHAAGMTVRLQLQPELFPEDFRTIVKERKVQGHGGPYVIADPSAFFDDERTLELARTQIRAYLDTYPGIDGVDLEFSAGKVSQQRFRRVFPDPNFWRRPDGRDVAVRVRANEFPNRAYVAMDQLDRPLDSKMAQPMILLTAREKFLPSSPVIFPTTFATARQQCSDKFLVDPEGFSDHDLPVYWLSRSSFGAKLTFEQTCREVIDPTCGEGVADRVLIAFHRSQQAQQYMEGINFGGSRFGPVDLQMIELTASRNTSYLVSATDQYLDAMNEMYRANTRAREGGRAFTLYWARRFEFAFEYLTFAQAVQKAGAAEQAKDSATQVAELEKAIESLNNGINALAAVARSNSDRGVIAVLNKYGYRPLKKKLAEAEKGAK